MLLTKGIRLVSLEVGYEYLFLVSAFLLGLLKARIVFRKVAYKMSERLASLSEPVALQTALGWRFAFIMMGATCMGQLVQHSGLPDNVRGLIDITVGVALSLGSLWCF